MSDFKRLSDGLLLNYIVSVIYCVDMANKCYVMLCYDVTI